ncbi:ArfGap-domain-containing protein [Marasmius fiardii PR-910]|nr:ArfGap-domain-containing protein [Marasmius fiardii PR-910]
MSRQDKATTDRHAKILRELVKRPDNKLCADCKRNDPRWASWNLGVFLCIRCSGIHRGMGTHISKVKSVDLDVWTPEQMESIQKWGNRLANLYWESHLKAGHIPPDHKMESFIRSKYESRRWAMEGPLPVDPSILDSGREPSTQPTEPPVSQASPPSPPATTSRQAAPPATNRQPQGHQLLSAGLVNQHHPRAASNPVQVAPAAVPAQPPSKAPENDLFSLDFHTPPSASPVNNGSASQAPKKDAKQDILSLFSAPPPQAAPAMGMAQFGGASPWATAPVATNQMNVQPTSMMGTSGAGMWGASSGWTGPVPQAQSNVWGTQPSPPVAQQQPNLFASSNDIWGGAAGGGTHQPDPFGSFGTSTTTAQKKDDVFGDIWGGFK